MRAKALRKHHVEAVTANVSFTNTSENKEKTRTSLHISYLLNSDQKASPKLNVIELTADNISEKSQI